MNDQCYRRLQQTEEGSAMRRTHKTEMAVRQNDLSLLVELTVLAGSLSEKDTC